MSELDRYERYDGWWCVIDGHSGPVALPLRHAPAGKVWRFGLEQPQCFPTYGHAMHCAREWERWMALRALARAP